MAMASYNEYMNHEQIKNLRLALQMNHKEFAAIFGVTENTVYRWESGVRNPTGSAIKLLEQLQAKVQRRLKLSSANAS